MRLEFRGVVETTERYIGIMAAVQCRHLFNTKQENYIASVKTKYIYLSLIGSPINHTLVADIGPYLHHWYAGVHFIVAITGSYDSSEAILVWRFQHEVGWDANALANGFPAKKTSLSLVHVYLWKQNATSRYVTLEIHHGNNHNVKLSIPHWIYITGI